MRILDLPEKHPLSVLMVFAGFLLFGGVSFFFLKLEELPELPLPVIRVVAGLPSYPPREIEQVLTVPLENALTAVKGVKEFSSLSKTGFSAITLRFDWDVNRDMACLDVREAIDRIYPFLPEGTSKPVAFLDSLSEKPVLTLVCLPREGVPLENLYTSLKYDLQSRLRAISGVGQTGLSGLRKPELLIELDMDSLYGMNLSIRNLASYLGQYLIDLPAGKVNKDGRERMIHVTSGVGTPQDFEQLPVGADSSLLLGQLAGIRYEPEEMTSFFLYRGKPAVGMEIYKSSSSGGLQTALGVKAILPFLNKEFKDSFQILVLEDSSLRILHSVRLLLISLFLGLFAASAVLFRIYRKILIPLVIGVTIPVTLILVFFFLFLFDISLNTVSLLGMVIGIGLIADNTIVILEGLALPASLSSKRMSESIRAVSPAVTASTLTSILVFIPPLLIPSVSAVLFRDLIFTIVFLILLSAGISHLFAPSLYKILYLRIPDSPHGRGKKTIIRNLYGILLLKGLSRKGKTKKMVPGIFLFLQGLLIFLIVQTPVCLLPASPANEYTLQITLPEEWNTGKILKEGERLSRLLEESFQPRHITVQAGYEKDSFRDRADPRRYLHLLNIHLIFSDVQDFSFPEEIRNQLEIGGYPHTEVTAVKNSMESVLNPEVPSLSPTFQPVLRFTPDRESLLAAGLTAAELQKNLAAVLKGIPLGEVPYGQEKITVRLKGREESLRTELDLGRLKVPTPGGLVMIENLVDMIRSSEPRFLIRLNRGNGPVPDKEGSGGQYARLFLFALILMYLILGIQSGSPGKSGLLMGCLPLSLTGSLLMLRICGYNLNLYAFMGILIMQGTIINTGILLLDKTRTGSKQEILSLCLNRLRPVSATTLTTLCALFPYCLSP